MVQREFYMVKKEVINRFDITALQDSFSESAMAAACPKEFWRKPTYVEYVRNQNPWDGIRFNLNL